MSSNLLRCVAVGLTLCTTSGGIAQEGPGTWLLGDEALTLRVSRDARGHLAETFLVHGVEVPYRGIPAAVRTAERPWESLGVGTATEIDGSLRLEGNGGGFARSIVYEVTGPGLITKRLVLKPETDVVLEQVAPAAFPAGPTDETVSTNLQDIALFRRHEGRSLFVSLDFPWSRITTEDGVSRVTYPPHTRLPKGEPFVCHSVTFGAARLSGEMRYGRDTGEVAAMDRYVQSHRPQRFDHPMFVSACINNRYTMPRNGLVWYTYKDHPTLSFNTDLLKRELDLMPRLGMEYYQVFPGIFDWAPGDPDAKTVHEIVAYSNARGVRIGDYSGCNAVFCPHYNEYGNHLDRPEWRMADAAGNAGGFCFGCPEFAEYYTDTVVGAAREYGFQLHCLDFLSLAPCFADHGHPPGDAGLYHQVAGLVRFLEELAAVDPKMMVWSNSGNWVEFLPKLTWYNPNMYLTDPFIATPWQGLNMTRLLDDARREQMVSLHYTHFMPYRNYTNCQYFFSQNSIVPDARGNYQYGALASLAVTPNLCLAEVRPWLDRLPAEKQQEVEAFYQRWTRFLRDHYDLWTETHHAGDSPSPGGIEVYGHADGGHGYIFIVNPNFWGETVDVPLDDELGFDGSGACEVRELYPVERLVLTSHGPTPDYGATLLMEAPAQQVRVLEVRPALSTVDTPRLFGIPGTIEASGEDWLLRTEGAQGTTHHFAIQVPGGAAPITEATVRADTPRQAKRLYAETPLTVLGQNGPDTHFEITYRRTAAPTELRQWKARPADAAAGNQEDWIRGFDAGESVALPLPIGTPLANFLGGYVDNAFSEAQETWIDLRQGEEAKAWTAPPHEETTPPTFADNGETNWWLQADFHLPFMYTIGAEPAFDEHTILVLPMRDPSRVTEIKAWVNGVPLDVRRYAYPRNRSLFTYWADLVGSGARGGENVLVLHAAFADN